jgi:hypothetical protein
LGKVKIGQLVYRFVTECINGPLLELEILRIPKYFNHSPFSSFLPKISILKIYRFRTFNVRHDALTYIFANFPGIKDLELNLTVEDDLENWSMSAGQRADAVWNIFTGGNYTVHVARKGSQNEAGL